MNFSVRSSKDLGHALKRARLEKNLKQVDIANDTRVKQNAVSRLESGQSGVVVDLLFRILARLDLEIEIKPRQKTASQDIANIFKGSSQDISDVFK